MSTSFSTKQTRGDLRLSSSLRATKSQTSLFHFLYQIYDFNNFDMIKYGEAHKGSLMLQSDQHRTCLQKIRYTILIYYLGTQTFVDKYIVHIMNVNGLFMQISLDSK